MGLGYVGVTTSACLLAQGHVIHGVDVNARKVEQVAAGSSPISEPEVAELLEAGHAEGRLTASSGIPGLSDYDAVIVCVGTPSAPDGSHNMSFIAESARQIAEAIEPERATPITVAFRSTFRPGTMTGLVAPIFASTLANQSSVELVYNPEFLRESTAVDDFNNPPKIVVGTSDGRPASVIDELYKHISAPRFNVRFKEAELSKFVDNTWHAMKVAYANEIGRICTELDINSSLVHRIFISDTKLNISPYYLKPGGAFGGSCLPKDVRALQQISLETRANTGLIGALIASNEAHKAFQFSRIAGRVSAGARILLVGLTFKSGTDDLRESPNVTLARQLLAAGYRLNIFDPALRPEHLVGQNLGYAYTQLPDIKSLLVELPVDVAAYDLVVTANRTAEQLNLHAANVIRLDVLT